MSRVRVTLNPAALLNNVAVLRGHCANARLMAVVKSNAYGHGVEFVARRLLGRVDGFAVATVDEGVELRAALTPESAATPVWVLSDFDPHRDAERVRRHALHPVVHDARQWGVAPALLEGQGALLVKVDVGMGRLGFRPAELAGLLDPLRSHPGYPEIRLLAHLPCADDPDDPRTAGQIRAFDELCRSFGLRGSLANSAAVLGWPRAGFDAVRPGLALFGASPLAGRSAADLGLEPVMTASTRVLSVRVLDGGQRVGYGGLWRARRATRVAVLACGYGDGYPRRAASGTQVLIGSRRAPVIGQISMDSMSVDVTDLRGVKTGNRAVLWGEGLPAEEVAASRGTIAYELFCRFAPRSPEYRLEGAS